MSLKPKTSRRLLLVAAIAVLALILGVALLGVRKLQRQRRAEEFREQGMSLYAKGDYLPAMSAFAHYYDYRADDREALLTYAKCREKIEEPDGKHYLQAIEVYRKCMALEPDDRETALHLLELYATVGRSSEARDLAFSLRPASLADCTDADVETLRHEIAARLALNAHDPAVEDLINRVIALKPDDHAIRVIAIEYRTALGRRSEAVALAQEFSQRRPDDPRARLLEALARRDEPGFDATNGVFSALCDIAGLDPRTAGVTRAVQFEGPLEALRISALFDSLSQYQHALAVLIEASRQSTDEVVARSMARRAWMAGRQADVAALTQGLDPAPGGAPSEVVIFRALSLHDLNRDDEVRTLAAALRERSGDYRAGAWADVLDMLCQQPAPAPDQRLSIAREALRRSPGDPVLRTLEGDIFADLGRSGEARRAWSEASRSNLAVGWVQPWLRLAYASLNEGKPKAAFDAAAQAVRIAPRRFSAYAAYFAAQAGLLEQGFPSPTPEADLLAQVDRIDADIAAAETPADADNLRAMLLPGRALLTARVRGADAARDLIRRSLEQSTALAQHTLEQLLMVSLGQSLGLEDELLTRLEDSGGASASTAFARARVLAQRGDAAAGARLLIAGAERAASADRTAWSLSLARYYDHTRDPKARETWQALASEAQTDLRIQLAALDSPAVVADGQLVETIIQRASKLGGIGSEDVPAPMQLARARALLVGDVTAEKRRQAVDSLRAILAGEPDLTDARALLISVLLMDNPAGGIQPLRAEAIQQIQAIIPVVPNPDAYILQMARLHRSMQDLASAKAGFERVALSTAAPTGLRLEAIDELVMLRELGPASTALERLRQGKDLSTDTIIAIKLGGVYSALGRSQEALTTLRTVDAARVTDPDLIGALADALAGLGDLPRAQEALARLDALEMPAERRATARARFLAKHGNADQAVDLLRQVTQLTPQDADAWINLASLLVEIGRVDDARATLVQARAQVKDSARIDAIERNLDILALGDIDPARLERLAEVLDSSPGTKPRAQAVRAIDAAYKSGRLTDPQETARLAEQYQSDPLVQAVLARVLLGSSPPRVVQAGEILTQAMRRHPTARELAVVAVDAFRALRDWSAMLSAAQMWQSLSRDRSSALAVAEAMLNLRQADGALQQVRPFVPDALAAPDAGENPRVLALYLRGLASAGDSARAETELGPTLTTSAFMRAVWLATAGELVTPEDRAVAWIERAGGLMPAGAAEQTMVAGAYATLAQRFPSGAAAHLARAEAVLEKLASDSAAPASVFESLGYVRQLRGNTDPAIAAYRNCLAKDAKAVGALRGLSRLLSSRAPDEAVALARSALDVTGAGDVESQLTLASACLGAARAATSDANEARRLAALAAEAYRAALEGAPQAPGALLGIVSALDQAGRLGETWPYYERLLNLPALPSEVQRGAIQNNFADAIVRAGKSKAEFERARELALAATESLPAAVTFDTLGSAEQACGNRQAAIAAFRRALQLDKAAVSASIGLASVLVEGSPEEKAEAKSIVENLPVPPESLPSELGQKLRDLRSRL